MNEVNQPITVTVRALLAHFHDILAQAQRTGQPVIIALRRRTPAGVLLGYEAWQALQAEPPIQASTSTLQVELAAERQKNSELAADLAATRQQIEGMERDLAVAQRQIEDTDRDLTAARQRVAELAAQLAWPQPTGEVGATWGVTPPPAAPTRSPEASLSWGSTAAPVTSGWGRS